MKPIVNLIVGVVLGAVLTVPLAATAQENATLRDRVERLEYRLDTACTGAKLIKPTWYRYLRNHDAC